MVRVHEEEVGFNSFINGVEAIHFPGLTALEWSGSTSDGITPEPYDPSPVLSHVKWRYSMRGNVLLVTVSGVDS